MAGLYIETKLRPCYVGERKALFHCWSHESGGARAIVEFENGEVYKFFPEFVRFIDNKFMDYSWEEGNPE